jgi:hypothetical protein
MQSTEGEGMFSHTSAAMRPTTIKAARCVLAAIGCATLYARGGS